MGEDCLVTVDGKDFETDKQRNVKIFWSHKFKNSGLHYEFTFGIKTGCLVWIHGHFPCGDWPDLNIFCHGLKNMLDENECVEADDGYIGEDPKLIKVPKGTWYQQYNNGHTAAELARNCHETGNCLLTKFGILAQQYTNDLTNHDIVI